jgi:NADH-quinone oxidoreductase subunit M
LLNGFIGEFLILTGSFQARAVFGILAATGVIWSACYMLWLYQRIFYGEIKNPANASLPDLNGRERASVWPLAIAAVVMGVFPMIWLNSIDSAVTRVVKATQQPTAVTSPISVPAPTVSPVQTAQENR